MRDDEMQVYVLFLCYEQRSCSITDGFVFQLACRRAAAFDVSTFSLVVI
jgi:hypothetical protein